MREVCCLCHPPLVLVLIQYPAEALVRAKLPGDLVKVLGVESQSSSKAEAFTQAFLKSSIQHHTRHDLKTMLSHKAVVLGYSRPKKDKVKRSSKKAKGLNACQKRALKIFQIKPEHQRYKLFLSLHELWRQYIIDLCGGLKPTCSPQFVQQKLLKADFHGAIITVVRSKCPSYVGTTGILIQEFKHVFKIITEEDRLKDTLKCQRSSTVGTGSLVRNNCCALSDPEEK
uniref:Ribonuclease P protein subunit p29 n=1 Tax=Seriola dumerili TaxID=41447 RepID=A0A3B4V9J0_SERDU